MAETGGRKARKDGRDQPAEPGEKLSTHWTNPEPSPLVVKGYRDWVEEQIQEAMARGDFADLPGKGKPLRLDGDPLAEQDWLVNHILSNAHVLPEWITLDKEIRADLQWLREHPGHGERAERVAALNRKIDRYNLSVPSASLQRPRLPRDF